MVQNERRVGLTVPELDGRGAVPGSIDVLERVAAYGPVALVLAGIGTTAIWAAFLAWCVFAGVRWMLA